MADENIVIHKLLNQMEKEVNEATKLPFSGKVSIDKNLFLNWIYELKHTLPYELETAVKIMAERDNIIENANNDKDYILQEANREKERLLSECDEDIIKKRKAADAEIEHMIQQATVRASELVSESRILTEAKMEAEKLTKEAREFSSSIRTSSIDYAIDIMENIEMNLADLLDKVRDDKKQLY